MTARAAVAGFAKLSAALRVLSALWLARPPLQHPDCRCFWREPTMAAFGRPANGFQWPSSGRIADRQLVTGQVLRLLGRLLNGRFWRGKGQSRVSAFKQPPLDTA